MCRKVSVLIPAYNESDSIFETVVAVSTIPEVGEIIVVNDASTDNTAEIAEIAGAHVFSLAKNGGKGNALTYGAEMVNFSVIALLDADLGATAIEARHLIMPVLNKEADMTIARFPSPRKKGGFGLVKNLATSGIKRHTGLEMHSPLSGQRVMTREVMDKVLPFASGYGVEVALTIKVAKMGYKIIEIPVQMYHAETGRDIKGFMHRGKQFVHIIKVLAGLKREGA